MEEKRNGETGFCSRVDLNPPAPGLGPDPSLTGKRPGFPGKGLLFLFVHLDFCSRKQPLISCLPLTLAHMCVHTCTHIPEWLKARLTHRNYSRIEGEILI